MALAGNLCGTSRTALEAKYGLTLDGAMLRFRIGSSSADESLVNVGQATILAKPTPSHFATAGPTSLTPGIYTLMSLPAACRSGGTFTLGSSTTT